MNKIALGIVALLSFAAVGCASGPKYKEVKSAIPSLSAEQGRIYFYRSNSMFGAAIQPQVKLNGKAVGDSIPGGFFYVDGAPGNYEVMMSTEVDKTLSMVLEPRQQKCVRMTVGLGIVAGRVYPELVSNERCDSEIQDLSYIGTTSFATK